MQGDLESISAHERSSIQALVNEPRQDILTQTLALHYLFEQGDEGGEFAMMTYLVLTALFMLVDTIPLMVKFFCDLRHSLYSSIGRQLQPRSIIWHMTNMI